MLSGKAYEGLMSDIWSCGVVVYAMLCGFLPFEDPVTVELYRKIMKDEARLPDFLTPSSKNLLDGMLHKDPAKRFTIAQIRKHEFCVNNEAKQQQLRGITAGKDEIKVDPLVIDVVAEGFKMSVEEARVMVATNRHNSVTATYYLLLNDHIRSGGVSIADLSRQYKEEPPVAAAAFPVSDTHIASVEGSRRKEIKTAAAASFAAVLPSTAAAAEQNSVKLRVSINKSIIDHIESSESPSRSPAKKRLEQTMTATTTTTTYGVTPLE